MRWTQIISVVVFLLLLEFSICEYYDDQPKFLTENGNFIIESAVNKNISFRLKGSACLNVNDMNVMSLLQIKAFNRSNVPNSNLASRISSLEEQIRSSPVASDPPVRGNRRVMQRLSALEARMYNGTSGVADVNITSISRRIRRLEIQFIQLTQRLNADNCSSNPCKNGGQCLNTFGGYICKCTDSWEGANCEDDVNECANFAGTDLGCQNMATCENIAGGYRCRCQNGWYGTHCTRRTVDCLQSSSYELCGGHGACVHTNDANGYRCICDQGWISNGSTPACNQDINECDSPTPHCSKDPEVVCINLPGTYTCGQCPHGYTGNGHFCKDINECEINNGGCSTVPYVACINTRGSSKCAVCPFGYSGDGRVCIRTFPAFLATDSPTGIRSTFVRPCESNAACHPVARCIQNTFGMNCICPFGYTGDGFGPFGCERSNTTSNVCSSSPCLNGGTCTNVGLFGFRCVCPAGTLPPRCTLLSAGCASNPCQSGGTCRPFGTGNYRCLCPAGRIGRNCQMEVRTCGGVLNAANGTLKYPLSSTYPHNSRCAWLIKTDEDKVLNITFKRFALERSSDCRYDWLQIHDGRSSASYMIGRFCGSDLPKNGTIVTTQNMLYLWFRSDNSSSHDGFELTWNTTTPVCGGELDITEHGTIKSPGSPGNYPPNRDCIWTLTAPPSKRIQLHFFTMQLEAHETCQYDYLAIYNGLSTENNTPIEKFCNTTHPTPITSSGNELKLHFHSDSDGSDAGFQIHYTVIEGFPGCGGTFTAMSGEFGSPIQNGVYPKNINCQYLIRLPKGSKIELTFLSFSMESSSSCSFDYVEIYEGPNENAPKAGRWCGVRIPPKHSSLTNEVTIIFRTDWSFFAEGFRIKYETVCGGKFEDNNGNNVIMSPFYPKPYDNSRNCIFDIEAPLGKAIALNFMDFDIESDCEYDSLTIYDGPDTNSKMIGEYCGEEQPPPALSSLNHLQLIFKTDSSISGRGFKANYSFIDAGCGGIIKKLNVSITPPKFGDSYVNNGNCKWIIFAPLGYLVQLSFASFQMEEHDNCRYDYVSVYDNIVDRENSSTPMGKYCGSSIPPVITSTTRALTLFFKSDDSVGREGFVATYSFIDGRDLCGGTFYAPTGVIRSPGFPNEYQTDKNCVYIIHAPNGKQIDLHIKSFRLEENAGCTFDFLEIRNGGNNKSPLIGQFCGTDIIPNIRSFSNILYLRFHTDSSNQFGGFELEYDTSISGCGGTFRNAQHGSLTSPNYPEPYGANMQCDYRIHVAKGSTINLVVTDLDLETSIDCGMDYISFYDGEDASARHIGTYCQTGQIIQVESTTNNVFIRMVSDINNQGRGFEIKFNAVCQREIRDLRGVIESPNFPENYPNLANCSWRITPPLGNRLLIEFSHFEFERSFDRTCTFDFITIEEHDSNDMTIRSNKYCTEMPKPLNTSNTVIVKFESDFSNTAVGFHLEYEVQGCGATLNRPDGRFASPNYPNSYPHDTQCQWIIEVDYGHLIEISFTDFDFEASPGCYQDGLVISNDQNATKILNKFCGSIHNASNAGVVTSATNKVFVHFFSDLSYSGRGFSATYKSVPTKCGGLFTLSQGNITSMNYPNNYESRSHCEWLIRTESSHSISFLFNDFDLQSSENCSDDVVKVYDGSEKRDDKILLRVCGNGNQNGTGFGKPLISESSELLVVMDSDDSFESKGFSATYEPRCGSKINTSTSGLLQIGHNLRWLAQDCQWVITAENPSQHVSLSILHLENEPIFQKYVARFSNQTLSPCLRKILIYDGTSTSAPKIMEICTNKHPPTIVSEGNSLTIALDVVADNDFAFTFDLKAAYSVIDNACGGEFSSVSGQIASPGYPRSYKNNIECEWWIKASAGNKMVLNIDMLDIDAETPNCNGDYLEIRETNSFGNLLGVYCGSNIPPTLPSSNTYWLKFSSDNDGVGNGFRAEYSYARIVEQNGSMGVITSPMYPSYIYYTLDSYKWRITVERGNVIRISIDNCILKRDSQIQIYDGYDSSAGVLSNIETDDIPSDSIVSTTNIVMLEFQVNTFSESKFKLSWNKVPKSSIETISNGTNTLNCTENSVVTVGTSDVLRIRSPGWPNGYESGLNCSWTFLPGAMGYHVSLLFVTIDLEIVPNCIADFVTVGSSNSMQNFNNSKPMCNINSVSQRDRYHGTPNLQLNFQSDYGVNRSGFESIVLLDCGGLLDSPSGNINHNMTARPAHLLNYWISDICTYNIKVRIGRTIKLNFEQMNLEKNTDGTCANYLLIRNGPNEESPFLGLGKFCGRGPIEIANTSSNQAMIQYVRGRANNVLKKEFVLNYEQVEHGCGGDIMLKYSNNKTIITTPNYPNIPSSHIECIWRVTAPGGELLRIDFLERFDLSVSAGCVTEFLQIQEGSTTNSPVNSKLCGSKMPSPIVLSSNLLRLHYLTDVSNPRNGFKLKVSFVSCGKSISSSNGFLISPGYPGKGAYPKQAICDYHVSGFEGFVYNLTFTDLDLPSATNCSTVDHIEIISSMTNSPDIIIATICGATIPNPILTYTSNFLVRLVTKSENSLYRGYRIRYQMTSDVCGETIEASTGIIQSPGYPTSSDSTRVCQWKITVPKGRRVKIDILDFDASTVVQTPIYWTNTNQRLDFYNDYFENGIISVISANETNAPIYSTDNRMTIQSLIRSNMGHRGFKLRFSSDEQTICEGNMDEPFGIIQTPENATGHFYCEFGRNSHQPLIPSQPDRGTLSIKFEQQRVVNSTHCQNYVYTGITIIYKDLERKAIVSKCPPKNENIASPFPSTKIIMKTSPFKFVLDYKIHACGGIFRLNATTRFSLPNLDSAYGELDCAWQFTSNSDQALRVMVTSSALNCETDYINIYNGRSPIHPQIYRICGDAVQNQTIEIGSKNTFIDYHTDRYQRSNSFNIEIISMDGICGGVLDAPNFLFSTPKNGTKYPANAHCEWLLRARSGSHVGLYFPQRFMLETSDSCQKDYVQIFDKVDDKWKPLARFCGRDVPHYVNSTGQYMKVVFHSDGDGSGDGFQAAWNENCGGIFTATNLIRVISSPRFPDRYPKNAFCNYSIVAAEDSQSVNLKFLKFDLERTSRSCNYDNVTIYYGERYNFGQVLLHQMGVYCWNDSITTFRNLRRIDVVFRSDSYFERSGFLFEYNTDRCGGNITQSTRISSSENGKIYTSSSSCIWNITAPPDKRITIRFEQFNLEKAPGCYLDYVDVFEGYVMKDSKRKAKLCGNLTEHAPSISINSNNAIVVFATDSSIELEGFTALILFTKKCNQDIRLNEGQQNYTLDTSSNAYEPLLHCEFFITASEGYIIQAKFKQFHLRSCEQPFNNTCGCDYLNIRDGSGPFAESLGTYCGHTNPPNVISMNNEMYMQFVTDSDGPSTGFIVEFKMIESPCGAQHLKLNETNRSTEIISPMIGNHYMANVNCLWTIQVDEEDVIDVRFDRFDLEGDLQNRCEADYLEITADSSRSYIREGLGENTVFAGNDNGKRVYFYSGRQWPTAPHRYCGNGTPMDYLSSVQKIHIRFKSNEIVEKSGFKLTASILDACARNYTKPQGRLYAKKSVDCELHIDVPENYTITLYFTAFQYHSLTPCTENNKPLKVYNDLNNNELIQSYCGESAPKPLFTTTNKLRLKFSKTAVSYYESDLYDITYLATDKGPGCGGELYNFGGMFTSPGYPEIDRNNTDCTWTINVPMNLIVALQFEVFDMGTRSCDINYLEIIEFDDNIAPTKFCGTDSPAPYRGKSNRLKVHFKSSTSSSGTGWVINFMGVHENSVIDKDYYRYE